MARSTLLAIAAALALFYRARAFEYIQIPDTVTAGEEATVEVSNDLDVGSDSFDAGFEKYRLYLSTSPPGWGWGPVCYLVNSSAIDVTSLKITVPASVVPDGTDLMVTTMEFSDDPSLDGPSGFQYSNEFTLEGGTGTWGQAELNGTAVGDPDRIPCTALKCTRDCTDKWYPDNMDEENWDTAFKSTYECIAACPGVTYPSWDEVNDNGNGDDGGSDSTMTSEMSAQPTAGGTSSNTRVSASQTASTTGTSSASSTTSSTPTATPNAAGRISGTTSAFVASCVLLFAFIV